MIGKIASLAMIGSTVAHAKLLQRFLEGAVIAIALTIFSAIITGILVVGGFYGAFVELENYGVEPVTAFLLIMGIAVLSAALLISLTLRQLRQLRILSQNTALHSESPLLHVGGVVHAFIDGFRTPSLRTPSRRL